MKESIGGTWLFTIVIAFVVLFATYVSVTTNYSRCFKIKDDIIETLESYGGANADALTDINRRLTDLGYDSVGTCPDDGGCWTGFSRLDNATPAGYGSKTNYCIKKTEVVKRIATEDSIVTGNLDAFPSSYYSVAVFFRLDWPIIRQVFNIKITGETGVILNPKNIAAIEDESHCMRGT